MAQVAGIEAGKTYRIALATDPKKSLFVSNSVPDNFAPIVLWTETDVPAQQWTAEVGDDGRYAFKNVYTGKYLNYSSGKVNQYSRSWWTVESSEDGTFYFKKGSLYLRVNETTDGSAPKMGEAQGWIIEEVESLPALSDAVRRRMVDGYLRQYMQDKGTGYRTFCNGGWGESETLETILDLYEATGDRTYLSIYEACYSYFRYHVGESWDGGTKVGGYDWFGYDFNDDVMWHIIGAARAYLLSGNKLYLDDAKRNFDLIYGRSHLGYIDMLRWAERSGDRNGTNSCINGPAEVAACYIGLGTGDESYFEKARALYANHRKYLANMSTGQVYDSMVFDPATLQAVSRNNWVSTYNQGTMLGAAVLLYQHYGDAQYRSDADKIISCSRSDLCDNNGIIRVCQDVSGDFQGFKGILMRYAGLYVRQFGGTRYEQWLADNAMRAFCNSNSRSFGHSAWLTKATENNNFVSGDKTYTYFDKPFGGSTLLAAAFAAPSESVAATVEKTAAEAGSLVYTINVPRSGHYRLNVFYKSDASQTVYLSVNDADATGRDFATATIAGLRPYFVVLREGDNTVTLTADSKGRLPEVDRVEVRYLSPIVNSLEAEHAEGHGGTTITNDNNASGGRYMGQIGNGANNYITFYYDADEAGEYDLDITYFCGVKREMYVRVNNGSKVRQTYEKTGSYTANKKSIMTVRVTLKTGTNTISLGNDSGWGPNVDKISLRPLVSPSAIHDAQTPDSRIKSDGVYTIGGTRAGHGTTQHGVYIKQNKKVIL